MRMTSKTANKTGFLARLRRDERGNTLAIVAGALVPLIGIIGGGVDISRAYLVKARLQQACDAGVLAGRKAVGKGKFDTAAQQQAKRFFDANFETGLQKSTGLTFTPTSPDNGRTVKGQASATLPTILMHIFGKKAMSLAVSCEASYDISSVDITLVLDTTGSMRDPTPGSTISKMDALRNAAGGFYDTMAAAAYGSSRIRYAFVPYTGTVNVGKLIRGVNPDYLDKTHSYETRVANFSKKNGTTIIGYEPPVPVSQNPQVRNQVDGNWGSPYATSSGFGCASAPSDNGWTNNGGPVTTTSTTSDASGRSTLTSTVQKQTQQYEYKREVSGFFYVSCAYYRRTNTREIVSSTGTFERAIYEQVDDQFQNWTYKRTELPNLSGYIAGNATPFKDGSSGATVSYSWAGCIEERDTVASDNVRFDGGRVSPTGMKDLDIDAIPANSEDGWKPYIPEISYHRTYNGYYTRDPQTTNNSPSSWKSQTSCPQEARLLQTYPNKSDFTAYLNTLNPDGGTYHDIGMIWGARLSSPDGIFAANVGLNPGSSSIVSRHIIFMTDGQLDPGITYYSAYGLEYWDRRITNDGSSNQAQRHRDRFLAACNAAKAKGIRVWVIAFATALDTSMTDCASPNSSYLSLNANDLNNAFVSIAQSISDLRLTQ